MKRKQRKADFELPSAEGQAGYPADMEATPTPPALDAEREKRQAAERAGQSWLKRYESAVATIEKVAVILDAFALPASQPEAERLVEP